ncbi:MAG: histidine kinase [Frankiales bacterium]|nr:histidine kinase [Frankiales bacterium]
MMPMPSHPPRTDAGPPAEIEDHAPSAGLADEQAALRRVATLVASGTGPEEVFAAVLAEVGQLFSVDFANLGRDEGDGTFTHVASWSRTGDRVPVGRRWPLGGDDVVGAPITVESRSWGMLSIGASDGQRLPADAETRLANFTEVVAMAIANVEIRAQLTASRTRIVGAADQARRRIERDLHDGAQQQLVTLGLKLRTLDLMLPVGLAGVHDGLGEIVAGLEDVIDDLRELSRGIYPSLLSIGGLEPALKMLARRAPVPVEVDLQLPTRPPDRIGIDIYYMVAEALTNVAKHGQASQAWVQVQARSGDIRVSVSDDGIGGADPSRGSGLLGLQDRAEALGATMTITSPSGAGTKITFRIPTIPE